MPPKLSKTQTDLLQVLADGGRMETSDSSSRIGLYDRSGQPQPEVWVLPATIDKLFSLGLIDVTKQTKPAHAVLRQWGITERGRDALAGRPWLAPETPPEIPLFQPGPPAPPSPARAEQAARLLADSLRLTTPLTPLWDERISPDLLESELIPWWTELILDAPQRGVPQVLADLFERDPAFAEAWESLGPTRHARAEILQKQLRLCLDGIT